MVRERHHVASAGPVAQSAPCHRQFAACDGWLAATRIARTRQDVARSRKSLRATLWRLVRLSYAQAMLPIFRIISVGGVTLAIAILVLALVPPGGTHVVLSQYAMTVRGPLMDAGQHPEWRQMILRAALQRADELERLRGLRDTIARHPESSPEATEVPAAEVSPQVAGLPDASQHDETGDVTGSIPDPAATIPIEIGETSSTELPVAATEDRPPAIGVPALQMPMQMPRLEDAPLPVPRPTAAHEGAKKSKATRRAVQHRPRRKPVAPQAQAVPPPFNIFAAIFGGSAKADGAGTNANAAQGAATTTSPTANTRARAQ